MRKHIFWVVAPCAWVTASRSFEECTTSILRVYDSGWLITLRMEAVSSTRRKQITIPQRATTQKTCFFDNHVAKTSNHGFCIVRNVFLSAYFIFLIYCVLLTHDWFSIKKWNYKSFRYIWRQSPCMHNNITLRTTKEMVILFGIKCWSSEWRLLKILLQSREEKNFIPSDQNVSDRNLKAYFSLRQIMVVRDHV